MKTKLEDDMALMREQGSTLAYRKYMAVRYRIEMKLAIKQQIKAGKIALAILKRMESSIPFESACSQVHELETEEELTMNRSILLKYLAELKRGINKNKS